MMYRRAMNANELMQGGWALTALALAMEGHAADPAVRDVVAALGIALPEGAAAEVLRADLRSTLATHANAVAAARAGKPIAGWQADDPMQVEAQAIVSEAMSGGLASFLGSLPGLVDRLGADNAAVLDVGAGGAGFGIAFARRWPKLRVVGIEPSAVAIEVGRQRIRDAGFADRIEHRQGGGEAVTDVEAFDVAYVAQMFIPEAVLDDVLRAAVRALRPGGYLLTAAVCGPGDTLADAIARLRATVWGGGVRFVDEVVARVRAAGLADAAPGMRPPGAMLWPVLGRRAI
jgi:precorrin-6B methylase 2